MSIKQLRIEMAHQIFLGCGGSIDKAMEYENMPYKSRKTLLSLARERDWYQEAGVPRPKGSHPTEQQMQAIRQAFIDNRGSIDRTAQQTGFSTSAISRYARSGNWRDQILQMTRKGLEQDTDQGIFENTLLRLHQDDKAAREAGAEEIIAKLKQLRQLLFQAITDDDNRKQTSPTLKIEPRTISEAVKALLDVDKRISEHEGNRPVTVWGPYQRILSRCLENN
jgi:hypothetical protein